MHGRSIGSKRFNVGEAGSQRTRASLYQEEQWTGPSDRRMQRRPAEQHPRALRHGLIASQLGLPMLARDAKEQAEESDPFSAADVYAAYGGEVVPSRPYASYDAPYNEQTTTYDEWELQKELVTYRESYPDDPYEEHPQLDLQLPPLGAYGHDDQQPPSPGNYPFAEMARHSAQPSAARWHSAQPIATQPGFAAQPRATRQVAAALPQSERAPVRRFRHDEPVVYPHNRSWLKRILLVVALAGAGYAAHHYYFDEAPGTKPALPALPPAAAVVTPLQAPTSIATPTPDVAEPPAAPLPYESAKARRSAARAALIAERRAARRTRADSLRSQRARTP